MDIIRMHSLYLPLLWKNTKITSQNILIMWYIDLNRWPMGYKFHYLGWRIRGHHNHAFSLSSLAVDAEKKFF